MKYFEAMAAKSSSRFGMQPNSLSEDQRGLEGILC